MMCRDTSMGQPLFAMFPTRYGGTWVQYTMNGFQVGVPVAIFRIKKYH